MVAVVSPVVEHQAAQRTAPAGTSLSTRPRAQAVDSLRVQDFIASRPERLGHREYFLRRQDRHGRERAPAERYGRGGHPSESPGWSTTHCHASTPPVGVPVVVESVMRGKHPGRDLNEYQSEFREYRYGTPPSGRTFWTPFLGDGAYENGDEREFEIPGLRRETPDFDGEKQPSTSAASEFRETCGRWVRLSRFWEVVKREAVLIVLKQTIC